MARKGRDLELLIAHLERILASVPVDIKSPDFIYDRVAEVRREVDVAVRGTVAGAEILVVFECRDRTRQEDVMWIEQLATKQRNTGTSTVVAVSSAGFSPAASRVAAHAGIQLRVLSEIAATDLFKWMGVRTMEVRLRTFRITHASVELDSGLATDVHLTEAAVARFQSMTDGTPVLWSKTDERLVSFHDAWLALGPQAFESELDSGLRRNLTLRVAYRSPEKRYQVETNAGLVDIEEITFRGLFFFIDQTISINKIFEYKQGEKTLAERVTFAIDIGSGPVNLVFDRTEDGKLFSVSAIEADGSPAATPIAFEIRLEALMS
ncbi:hypothetical protein [Micromonospora sp. NPDC005413]|uniref:hypothetical protein n=1 Tax=Micromonospora sp. NPDC005413 TaxID=3154563 RepID=UPI0033A3F94E